jgi:threonylcarbamoyladenosine tRNA methylthiotransferase MtaB
MTDNTVFTIRRVFFTSLGCKLNFAETSNIGRQLSDVGFVTVKPGEIPDVCIINTCSVTDTADKKSRQAINRIIRRFPDAFVVVTGCYAQLKPEEVASLKGVDLILGSNEKADLVHLLESIEKRDSPTIITTPVAGITTFHPAFSKDDRTRYFLKVQDGCDYNCSYCTIPLARGKSRNGTIASLVGLVEQIASEGGREIVLTGVNMGDFGKTTGESLLDLLKALDNVQKIDRFRISSVEPNLLTEEIIRFVSTSNRFMPHFHIPLQAGSDELLRLMKRRYTTALFESRIQFIRSVIPDAFIGVDVIVGSRGETAQLFDESYAFIEKLDVSQLHIFSYSERPGTRALSIDYVVSSEEKKHRHLKLQELSDAKWKAFYNRHTQTIAQVLVEHTQSEGLMHAFTTNYVRVELPFKKQAVNQIKAVRLGSFNLEQNALLGEWL